MKHELSPPEYQCFQAIKRIIGGIDQSTDWLLEKRYSTVSGWQFIVFRTRRTSFGDIEIWRTYGAYMEKRFQSCTGGDSGNSWGGTRVINRHATLLTKMTRGNIYLTLFSHSSPRTDSPSTSLISLHIEGIADRNQGRFTCAMTVWSCRESQEDISSRISSMAKIRWMRFMVKNTIWAIFWKEGKMYSVRKYD